MPEYEVSVSCKDLADKDLLSKSDPVLILLENVPFSKRFVELGKTELIKDCLSPQFARKFRLSMPPDRNPMLRVAVVDIDNFDDLDNMSDQEFIGRADFRLSDLQANPVFRASLGKSCGHVILKTSPYDASLDGTVTMEIALPGNGSHPAFVEFHRADHAATMADTGRVCSSAYSLTYRTETSVTGCFPPCSVSLFTLCRGDHLRLLRVESWRRCSKGDHKLVAAGFTCLGELQALAGAGSDKQLSLIDSKGRPHALQVKRADVQRLSAAAAAAKP